MVPQVLNSMNHSPARQRNSRYPSVVDAILQHVGVTKDSMSDLKMQAERTSCEHGSSSSRDCKLFKMLFFALAAQAPPCLGSLSNKGLPSIYTGKHSSQYATGCNCYSYLGVLQHFTKVSTAQCRSDAGKACKDLTQQSLACNSLCQVWCRIILYPQSAAMGGSQGERACSS